MVKDPQMPFFRMHSNHKQLLMGSSGLRSLAVLSFQVNQNEFTSFRVENIGSEVGKLQCFEFEIMFLSTFLVSTSRTDSLQ